MAPDKRRGMNRRLSNNAVAERQMRMQNSQGQANRGKLGASERVPLLPWLTLAFGVGVWLAPRVAAGGWPLWLLAVAGLVGVSLALLRLPLRWIALPLALMAALLWTQHWLNPAMPLEGAVTTVTARVYGEATLRDTGRIAITLCDVSLDGQAQAGRAYCTLDAGDGVSVDTFFDGAELRFTGWVYHPQGKQNENDFDFRLWLFQNGIHYGISGVKGLTVLNTPETARCASVAARARAACAQWLTPVMGKDTALAMAMLLGDRSGLEEDQQADFQRAGVAHLMTVSGLHVGLLAGALLWLLNALYVRKKLRLVIVAVFLALYATVTGFSAATVRASVMLLLAMLGQTAGRRIVPLVTLSAAALLVLILHPLQLFSVGFALSFGAMAGILLLYPPLMAWLKRRPPLVKRQGAHRKLRKLERHADQQLRQLLAMSLAAQAGVLLPTAAGFHQWPLYGMAFNLLAVPLAGMLVPLYALTLLCASLPIVSGTLGVGLGWIARAGSELLMGLVGLSNQLPYAQVRVPTPVVWVIAAFLAGSVALSRYVRADRGRRALTLGLCALLACGGAYLTRPSPLRYIQFAVGQGDAALLIDGQHTVAIDVGPYGGEMAGQLLAEGRSLDALILTHLHSDHAQGVAKLLAEGIPIRQVYLPDGATAVNLGDDGLAVLAQLEAAGVPVATLSAGDTLTFDQLRIEVLWPQAGTTRAGMDANERSLATLLRLGSLRILNMADNTSLYENYFAQPCDILKTGHHGSAGSTSDAFLESASPTAAILTCEADAALPSPDTLSRLAAHGVDILRTDETGEILIEPSGEGYRLSTYLER